MDDRKLRGATQQRCRDHVGTGSVVRNCDVHHNGQIGIAGDGKDILIEGNRIWSNNIYGFDPVWEAGGAKIARAAASRSATIMSMTTTVLAYGAISNVATSCMSAISSRTISTTVSSTRFRSTR